MNPFHAILAVIAFGAMCFSYGHSVQPDVEPIVIVKTVTPQKSALECLGGAVNTSQLMEKQSRSKNIPLPPRTVNS